jgi:hypothetical protein
MMQLLLCSSKWTTLGYTLLRISASKIYFDVEVKKAKGQVVVGFAGTNFNGEVIGFDEAGISWGFHSGGLSFEK